MVLAEKGTLDQAKDVFARVREVSAEVLGDVWINLAHVYLAQNKHNEVRLICTVCLWVMHHRNYTQAMKYFDICWPSGAVCRITASLLA